MTVTTILLKIMVPTTLAFFFGIGITPFLTDFLYKNKMFIVYYIGHVDCYKRAESYGDIDKVFESEAKAYEYAVKMNCKQINDDFGMSKRDWIYMKNKNISYKSKYNYLLDNFEAIYGEPEFTMQPSHTFYYIKKHKKFDDESFYKIINKITELKQEIKDLTIKDEEDDDDEEEVDNNDNKIEKEIEDKKVVPSDYDVYEESEEDKGIEEDE